MGEVWKMIEEWRDGRGVGVKDAELARAFGIAQSNLKTWMEPKSLPKRETIGAIARKIERPYIDVLEAFLTDMDYRIPPTLEEIETAKEERKIKQGKRRQGKRLVKPVEVVVKRSATDEGRN